MSESDAFALLKVIQEDCKGVEGVEAVLKPNDNWISYYIEVRVVQQTDITTKMSVYPSVVIRSAEQWANRRKLFLEIV